MKKTVVISFTKEEADVVSFFMERIDWEELDGYFEMLYGNGGWAWSSYDLIIKGKAGVDCFTQVLVFIKQVVAGTRNKSKSQKFKAAAVTAAAKLELWAATRNKQYPQRIF